MTDNDKVYIGDMEPDRNPGFETSDDTDVWTKWAEYDDGFRERDATDPQSVIIKQVSRCPNCKHTIMLTYRTTGISFEHVDDRLLVRFLRWVIGKRVTQ